MQQGSGEQDISNKQRQTRTFKFLDFKIRPTVTVYAYVITEM